MKLKTKSIFQLFNLLKNKYLLFFLVLKTSFCYLKKITTNAIVKGIMVSSFFYLLKLYFVNLFLFTDILAIPTDQAEIE